MNNRTVERSRGDRAGILVASLYFVHCIAGPVLLTFAGLSSLIRVSEKFEVGFLLTSAAMGTIALIPAYRYKHRRASCLAMFGCGLLCLFAKRHLESRVIPAEQILTGIGATLLINAHVLNLKYSKRCPCCNPTVESGRQETQAIVLGPQDKGNL